MTVLYLLRALLCCLALGAAMERIKPFQVLPDSLAFATGFSLGVLLPGVITALLGLVWPGVPALMCGLLPPLLAMLSLCLPGRWTLLRQRLALTASTILDWTRKLTKGAWKWAAPLALLLWALFAAELWWDAVSKLVSYLLSSRVLTLATGLIALAVFSGLIWLAIRTRFLHDPKRPGLLWRWGLLFLAGCLLLQCVAGTTQAFHENLWESDRSHYEMQARIFAQHRDTAEVDAYTGSYDGTVYRDDHGPLWPVILGDARLMADKNADLWNPATLDMAYALLFTMFLLLLYATGKTISGRLSGGILAVGLLLLYPGAGKEMVLGSRDAFRFLALLPTILLTLEFAMRLLQSPLPQQRKLFRIRDFILLLCGCALAMQGHTGNVYILLGLLIAFALLAVSRRIPFGSLVVVGLCALLGTLTGMGKTIAIYLETGSTSSSTLGPFAGTAVEQQIVSMNQSRMDLGVIFSGFGVGEYLSLLFGILGLCALGAGFVSHLAKKTAVRTEFQNMETALFVLIVGMLFPLTGIFDFLGYPVSVWFIAQTRYRIYLYLILALPSTLLLLRGIESPQPWLTHVCRIGSLTLLCLSVVLTYFSWPKPASPSAGNAITAVYREAAEVAEEAAGDGNVFVSEEIALYYCSGAPKLLFHGVATPLLQAKSEEDIRSAIAALDARAFLFDSQVYHDFTLLPFYAYVSNPKNALHYAFRNDSVGAWADVYVLR